MEMREVGKKELIVSSAKKVILEKGYKNISVEDITNEAGIAKGSFYTYFKSKNLVIDYILEEVIAKRKNEFKLDKRKSLENTIKSLVRTRIKLDDEKLKENLVLVNLFRNVASLDEKTLMLLKELEKVIIERMESIILAYPKEIKIERKDIKFYSKMLNNIISNYKTFTLFFSEKSNQFITDIEEVKKKYQTEDFERNIEIISKSILKILTY
ncbi:TetR/AcrR family transcriptional regulator [Fusobacterium mortiferum]|jgi:AcrR family transcriptional regulator|uniref:TetR/AcrR family transcriptional regulator n=1 Tax=Fusobacterium mortiferum ATCC 9817 TaxID=469616 RepID=A0ABM6TZL1_FUSMR|nr:TetR/AcrR family transcriptional regulator [Fusobacterium mortiferum ATCC 9817]RGM98351.1 TetR/AcrR family transcriptional regulator [Fusobacterium mortiferum]RHF65963.1 TetR/AcrR family transcriptional regulator [Fusobacterium mortiferum]